MNTQYQLIKTDSNYLLVSDEEIKNGDICLTTNAKGDFQLLRKTDDVFSYECLDGSQWVIEKNTYTFLKAIASLHKIEGLSQLVFADGVAKEIGYVDLDKKATEYFFKYWENAKVDLDRMPLYKEAGLESMKVEYKNIYTKALKDNEGKRYTEADIIAFGKKCFYKGFDKSKNDDGNSFESWREEAGKLIEENKPKTQWSVSISIDEEKNTITVDKII